MRLLEACGIDVLKNVLKIAWEDESVKLMLKGKEGKRNKGRHLPTITLDQRQWAFSLLSDSRES